MEIDGRRVVAYNADKIDDVGIIWCIVKENVAGYFPMTGSDEHQAPWYLAYFKNYTDEKGQIDYAAARASAESLVTRWNKEQGYSDKDVRDIMASSIRLRFEE